MRAFAAAIFLVFSILAAGPAQGQEATSLFPNEPVVQAGDTINVMVLGEPDLSGAFMVHANGSLSHPLYRDLHVAGVPFSQLDSVMGQYLTRFREDPMFTAEPRLTVVITGEVLEGGLLTFGPGVTIAQAVTYAGLTDDARIDQVRLIRDRQAYDVDFEDPDAQWSRVTIRSGDQIIVQQRPDFMGASLRRLRRRLGGLRWLFPFFFLLRVRF
jgi:polysaccharide export outer membrane protein